jgi:pilus assembly protein CpaB
MRMSNVIMLMIALVCAAGAAFFTRVWLVSQSARAPSATEQMAANPSHAIVVAARDLRYGDKLSADMLKLVSWPGDSIPKGAFLTKETVLGPSGSRVVLASVEENEPVLEQKLLGTGSPNAMSARLTENMKAITIRVNDVAGVAGFVQPEDRVDVFLTYGGKSANEAAARPSSSVVVLLQNIRVLAIDQVTQRKDQASPPKAVTLEVNIEDAQKLVLAGSVGELSLALKRIAAGADRQVTGTIEIEDLIDADRQARAGKPRPTGPVVGVTRSVERKEYQVLPEVKPDGIWPQPQQILSHQEIGR